MYATQRILSFTIEMGDSFTMPDEAIATETGRNLDAAMYAIEQAGRPAGAPAMLPRCCDAPLTRRAPGAHTKM